MMDCHTLDDDDLLGPCCVCGGRERVHTFVMLSSKSPMPGRGWGCLECGLSLDGAIAVVCDACEPRFRADRSVLRFACIGFPEIDGRLPIEQLIGSHTHDMSKHEPA